MSGPQRPINFLQNIVDGRGPEINKEVPLHIVQDINLNPEDLKPFDNALPLGISPGFAQNGNLVALAITDGKECRVVEFPQLSSRKAKEPSADAVAGRKTLQEDILCRAAGELFAFDMAPLAMALHNDLKLRMTNGIDIQSSLSPDSRKPLEAIQKALGDSVKLSHDNINSIFQNPIYDNNDAMRYKDLAHRAWISQFLATYGNGLTQFSDAKRINTKDMSAQHLALVAKMAHDATRLAQMKPTKTTHKIVQRAGTRDMIEVSGLNFTNRMRSDRRLEVTLSNQHGQFTVPAMVGEVSGRQSTINATSSISLDQKTIATVTSIGRDDPTTAESKRAATILRVLQGQVQLLEDNPWITNIWSATSTIEFTWPEDWDTTPSIAIKNPNFKLSRQLNPSQQSAVNLMMSFANSDRLSLIQGPPGTGKTSVISAFVQLAVNLFNRTGIWLVAQSNVAVKNIAEKLASDGFQAWKLLVSKDFKFDWHDHLYGNKIKSHIIQSDKYRDVSATTLQGTCVILCTLSTLSSSLITKFTRQVPLQTLVVDEASQIEIGNYTSIFNDFKTLRKVCFIGDNKQLPPYGQEDLQDLRSIFEVEHLAPQVKFLAIQYRMPPQIGDIISEAVYEGKLQSNPNHPVTSETQACYFVDAEDGREEQNTAGSFMNKQECSMVLLIAAQLQGRGKSYRIITPYDAQRNLIEEGMKEADLDWADKCFNVDSFQGNEDDFIIISVVRTRSIGFLRDLRRTNVMLTRCKKGMIIVTNKNFLLGVGSETLVATLLAKAGNPWLTKEEIENDDF